MTSKKKTREFEVVVMDDQFAMVVQRIGGTLHSVHKGAISHAAAEWLADDLQNEREAILKHRDNGDDLGALYLKAASVLRHLDYSRPAKANALTIAMADLSFGMCQRDDGIPF